MAFENPRKIVPIEWLFKIQVLQKIPPKKTKNGAGDKGGFLPANFAPNWNVLKYFGIFNQKSIFGDQNPYKVFYWV